MYLLYFILLSGVCQYKKLDFAPSVCYYLLKVKKMIRIWAKVIKNDKIIKQTVYEREGTTDYSEFFNYAMEICASLDVPTPVLIKTHLFNYAKYNHVNFRKSDFVESIDFDKLVFENALT